MRKKHKLYTIELDKYNIAKEEEYKNN